VINNVNGNEPAPLFQPVRTGSVRSRVLETLREAIFSGKLRPGDPIREAHMARALQVSQPTVREALLQLEHAGLVVRNPNRDTVVTSLGPQDVQERARLRVLLEGQAAVAAAARMEESDFARLEQRLAAIHSALERDSYLDYVSADIDFHRLIWQFSGNRTLYLVLDLITVPLFAFLSIRRSRSLKNLARSVHSHDPILAAMRSRDERAILDAFRDHVEGSYRQFQTEVPATAGGGIEQ
jgi:DNA-binding GntR family transcriptional regulator